MKYQGLLAFFITYLVLVSCSSDKKLFLKTGEVYYTESWNYCSDSLGIYNNMFNSYNVTNESFFKQKLKRFEKRLLKQMQFSILTDKILFHSINSSGKNSSTIGSLRKNVPLDKFEKMETPDGFAYFKFDPKYKTREIVYPLNSGNYFSTLEYGFVKMTAAEIEKFDFKIGALNTIKPNLLAIKNKICDKENYFKLTKSYFDEDSLRNYLTYKPLEKRLNKTSKNEKWSLTQFLATYQSFAQKEVEANETWNSIASDGFKNLVYKNEPLSRNLILDKVKNEKLIMINEAHHSARHRYLTGSLLQGLYDNGFRYFGLEAINNISDIEKFSFPTQASGFYTAEPNMANLIREAKRIGFVVFEYDEFEGDRETNQTNNIYNKTFKIDEKAKVLIHCGFSHNSENSEFKSTMLGYKMNELYKINPYTINQAGFRKLDKKMKLASVVSEKHISKNDLYINNSLPIENNCFSLRTSKNINLSIKNTDEIKPSVLLVYDKIEFEKVNNPVPVFLKVIENKLNLVNTNLCLGSYVVVTKDNQNEIIEKYEVVVD
ncbi:hypothetical protein [Flavobacterium terrigena]|uniref:Uncharacterized protein n=1 Tax=Flavobacterium terrigena TaxID=402734 RepID=A0A1H6RWF8_9FLAO|nr:hypothetical protein [Flavobacterium terrigena]SEI60188.1 hypothetical protein SAMN05660918_1097 [Flavobacterium terrigena]